MLEDLICQEDYKDYDESVAVEIFSIATYVSPSVHPDEASAPEFRSHRGRTIRLVVRYSRSMENFIWPCFRRPVHDVKFHPGLCLF